ncbi:MAG: Flp pilus assembly complex ATPase component TadA [Lachnospiraceae bacterium]|nr:Flp pilus assembly complex ATPase component TadA [Lachnospiraceae bacterium]
MIMDNAASDRLRDLIERITGKTKDNITDIHLIPGNPAAIRHDGSREVTLTEVMDETVISETFEPLLDEGLKRELAASGSCVFSYTPADGKRYRISVSECISGLSVSLHPIPSVIPSAEELSIPGHILELAKRRSGLILFTGAGGCGKTTLAASLADHINETSSRHIIILEETAEYILNSKRSVIEQRETGRDPKALSFAVREAETRDADVILAGSMEDEAVIRACTDAAMSGHLVISTVRSSGAVDTIKKLIRNVDINDREYMRECFASVISCIFSRLIAEGPGGERVFLREIMTADRAIRNLIKEEKYLQIRSLMQSDKSGGMITFRSEAQRLSGEGKIDPGAVSDIIDNY